MTKTLLDQAIALGMTTQEELKAFELGYVVGERDTLQRKFEEAKEMLDTPAFLEPDFEPASVTYNGERIK